MSEFRRLQAELVGEVPASADAAWELLNDWAGILRWWPKAAPIDIVDVQLVGAPDAVPRARHITVRNGPTGIETLLHSDETAMRIYYDLANGGIPGIRNYLATTTIDSCGDDRCLMRFSSSFDVPGEFDEPTAKAIILAVYNAILDGFRTYFQPGRAER